MSNPSQLLLLADHIKLSLLERQRAQSLNLEPNPTQDSNISRSLESFRESLESFESRSPDDASISDLRSQYNELFKQFHGEGSSTADATLSKPNDPTLQDDFIHARTRSSQENAGRPSNQKNVRFRDNPSQESLGADDEANRAALFQERYRDEEQPPDPTVEMSNQQVHEYHSQVMRDQDDQLDRLGESIGRQRYLGMQISDELEGQVALLDEVDRGVDRHQSRLDGAKRRLQGANWGMTTIIVLIVILVLLIVILK
ncbi:hypothetical protein LTR70_004221 [Exophiala xenobiotica]|uniref:t-SNARE coiled-coil homology domain-containing protein n=1 Tax=Lithohypha guttulata TaxID=1690604 RepID=A0ABR0KEK7_9EURO|nr:hypothetical protein LTR24_003703 [Lithohypha guttulata]KAK5321508.1 hypothetical protein LTR70_004221 [Exophiala xenobiotica]